jgi:lipid-binding SYLF domain-containing protein
MDSFVNDAGRSQRRPAHSLTSNECEPKNFATTRKHELKAVGLATLYFGVWLGVLLVSNPELKTNLPMNKMEKASRLLLLTGLCLGLAGPGAAHAGLFGPKGSSKQEKQANVRKKRDEMLAELYRTKPEMKAVLSKAKGYATFSQMDMNLFLLASGNGYGVLVDNRTKKETFMRVASLGGGVGFGVKDIRVIFVFHDTNAMKGFVEQGVQFGGKADASAKYQDVGVSAEQNVKAIVDYKDGTVSAGSSTDLRAAQDAKAREAAALATRGAMEIYQFTDSGVSLQATVSGTKYWKDSELNK